MPSTQIMVQSGGIALVSGAIYSGSPFNPLVGGIQFRLDPNAVSGQFVFVCLPGLSGTVPTSQSGGSLSSGGLADGMALLPGDSYFVPRSRLVSGVLTPVILAGATTSGSRLYWEPM